MCIYDDARTVVTFIIVYLFECKTYSEGTGFSLLPLCNRIYRIIINYNMKNIDIA